MTVLNASLATAVMVALAGPVAVSSPVLAQTARQPDAPAAAPSSPESTKPAATAKPDVATLLFSTPQWAQAPVGSKIVYSYVKTTTDAQFGKGFEDTISLKLDKGDKPDERTVEVKMFSGMNAKPAGPFTSDVQNPVLLLVFEENVQELSKLFSANPRYLKNAIRKAWRDDAKIEDAQVMVDGKMVPGTRITVTPFVNDGEKDKMKGLEGMVYTVEIADSVPGNIADIDIYAPPQGPRKFSETLRFKSETKP